MLRNLVTQSQLRTDLRRQLTRVNWPATARTFVRQSAAYSDGDNNQPLIKPDHRHHEGGRQDGGHWKWRWKSQGFGYARNLTALARPAGGALAAIIITSNNFHRLDGRPNDHYDGEDLGGIGNNNNKRGASSFAFEDLHQAILVGDERRAGVLLEHVTPEEVNQRHSLGWQLLQLAAVNGRWRMVEMLLEKGAEVNSVDNYTNPRLMGEQLNVDPMVVRLVRDTEFNADLARVNWSGTTALHYAVLAKSIDSIEALIKCGANPTLTNQAGFKAVDLANPLIAQRLARYEEEYTRRERELAEEERRRYPLEQRIKEHIVGQDSAISLVAATIRRKENGWIDENHPLVFLFLGSSGIGKTELAKQVAKYLNKDNKEAFIRLDMSEYQEQHSVARFLGSPPGYIGHNEGGQLIEALKKCKNAVVLFDEVEKAHPKVLTVLLQLFDEGRLTSGKGETIECKDAIFIMTSNLASEAIAEHAMQLRAEQQRQKEARLESKLRGFSLAGGSQRQHQEGEEETTPNSRTSSDTKTAAAVELGEEDYQETITISRKFKDTIVRPILKAHFQRDEFLGRINEMVYFLPFSEAELKQLVKKELEFWASKAAQKNKLQMSWDERVIDVISHGYDIHYGARSIKHEIERRIINQISELQHLVKRATRVHVGVQGGTDQTGEGNDLISIKVS